MLQYSGKTHKEMPEKMIKENNRMFVTYMARLVCRILILLCAVFM